MYIGYWTLNKYCYIIITSNVVVGEWSGGGAWWSRRVLSEINYWIITEM